MTTEFDHGPQHNRTSISPERALDLLRVAERTREVGEADSPDPNYYGNSYGFVRATFQYLRDAREAYSLGESNRAELKLVLAVATYAKAFESIDELNQNSARCQAENDLSNRVQFWATDLLSEAVSGALLGNWELTEQRLAEFMVEVSNNSSQLESADWKAM